MMEQDRLQELIDRFSSRRIVVIGDYFLDKYLDFDPGLAEASIETGRPANQVVRIRHSPGAAGTVVSNLIALGAGEVIPIGFTGDDGEGYDLRKDLHALRCSTRCLLQVAERHTPTYLKPVNSRLSGLGAESERFDTKNREPLPADVESAIVDMLQSMVPQVDAVIIADQVEEAECGVITSGVRDVLARVSGQFTDVIFWADSRRRIGCFENVITKPNQHEALNAVFPGGATAVDDKTVISAGCALMERTGRPVFVTRAEKGMLVFDESGCREVPGVRVEGPTDPTGAGDSATAGAVLALASGGLPAEAALVANLAASITIRQLGVTGTATPEQLLRRLGDWHGQR